MTFTIASRGDILLLNGKPVEVEQAVNIDGMITLRYHDAGIIIKTFVVPSAITLLSVDDVEALGLDGSLREPLDRDGHADRRDVRRLKRRYGPTISNPGYRKVLRDRAVDNQQASKDRATLKTLMGAIAC